LQKARAKGIKIRTKQEQKIIIKIRPRGRAVYKKKLRPRAKGIIIIRRAKR
jgi:hypothetical protein